MTRRITLLVLFIATMLGALSAEVMYLYGASLTATTDLVVPVQEIAPFTLITPEMVQVRAFPQVMAQAQVYRSVDEVIGNLTTTTLMAGQLIYLHQLAAPQQFHLTDNVQLEVVSFPIKPEQAVGAQLHIGQRVNVYQPAAQTSAIGLELVISDVRAASDGYLIVTVAAPPDIVRAILQSGAKGHDSLWVTLAPMQANGRAER